VSLLLQFLLPLILMTVLMAVLWSVQLRTRNAGIVDIAWSFGTGGVAAWFALSSHGDPTRKIAVAAIALAWGIRLGLHLTHRVMHEPEDGRYTAAREKWGINENRNMFVFFQIQAAWTILFALPMFAASNNSGRVWGALDFVAIAILCIALTGEGIADYQLSRFKLDPENKGKVCNVGLWNWSRHPNYFFEWIHWFAYIFFSIGGSYVWLAGLGPIVMYYFLNRVTGIPITEARALKSRGDAYRKYIETTSAFFPIPPKTGLNNE